MGSFVLKKHSSYPVGTEGSFLRGKAVGAWSWPFTTIFLDEKWSYASTPPYAFMA
jgi:hypothetical protein